MASLASLPADLILEISSWTNKSSLFRLESCCKEFRRNIFSDFFWRRLTEKRWGSTMPDDIREAHCDTFRDYFIKCNSGLCNKALYPKIECVRTVGSLDDKAVIRGMRMFGNCLVTGSEMPTAALNIINSTTYETVTVVKPAHPSSSIICVVVLGEFIFTGSVNRQICKWDARTGAHIATFAGHQSCVWAMQGIAPNRLVSVCADQRLIMWDVETGDTIQEHHSKGTPVTICVMNKTTCAAGTTSGTIIFWDMANNCIDERNHGNEASNIYAITRVTDDLVAVPQKHDIRIQSVTGDTKTILVGHTGLIVHLQLMDEELGTLVSGSYDHSVRIWNWKKSECLFDLKNGGSCWAICVDRFRMYTTSDGDIKVWEPQRNPEQSGI